VYQVSLLRYQLSLQSIVFSTITWNGFLIISILFIIIDNLSPSPIGTSNTIQPVWLIVISATALLYAILAVFALLVMEPTVPYMVGLTALNFSWYLVTVAVLYGLEIEHQWKIAVVMGNYLSILSWPGISTVYVRMLR
jgi:hypothetical protein